MEQSIKPHESWKIKDPSKLTTFVGCPRQYFYEYLLGWRLDAPAHDPYFGESVHRAMEHLLTNGYDNSSIVAAFDKFLTHYRKVFTEDTDEIYIPKTPEAVLRMLPQYCERWERDFDEAKVLYTEISGSVPVTDEDVLYFRMDSVLEDLKTGKKFSRDHKTRGKSGFTRQWEQEFYLSLQTGTYTHALYCLYPEKEVDGIEYNGIQFKYLKTRGYEFDFKRVQAWKTKDQMVTWLWNTLDILDRLDEEMQRLDEAKEDDLVLEAFPLNPTRCTAYWGCVYHDFCLAWANPLQYCSEPLPGFKVEYWDPRSIETRTKMDLVAPKEVKR